MCSSNMNLSFFLYFLAFIGFLFLFLIFIRFIITYLPRILPEQDLGKKYHKGYALITGGTDGIGLEISKKLIEQGFSVNIVGLQTDKIKNFELPENSILTICDLSEPENTKQLCNWIEIYQPKLLIHSAGYCEPYSFHLIKEPRKYNEAFISSMVDLTSTFLKVRKNNGGIVFFSSQVSFFSNPYASLYAATKAYTEQFARSIALEQPNLDVLVVLPGAVNNTSFFNKFPKYWAFSLIRLLGNDVKTASSIVFRSLGRVSSIDFGLYTFSTRIIISLLDSNIVDFFGKVVTYPLRKYFDSKDPK